MRPFALLALVLVSSCGPPAAVRYLVKDEPKKDAEQKPKAEQEVKQSPPLPQESRAARNDREWPIYRGPPPENCSPGLIGDECERGLLENEPPLEVLPTASSSAPTQAQPHP